MERSGSGNIGGMLADCCIPKNNVTRFGSGSVMAIVWGGICGVNRARLVVVHDVATIHRGAAM